MGPQKKGKQHMYKAMEQKQKQDESKRCQKDAKKCRLRWKSLRGKKQGKKVKDILNVSIFQKEKLMGEF